MWTAPPCQCSLLGGHAPLLVSCTYQQRDGVQQCTSTTPVCLSISGRWCTLPKHCNDLSLILAIVVVMMVMMTMMMMMMRAPSLLLLATLVALDFTLASD